MFNFLFHNKKTQRKLFFQTEMHCHLVPGIDDGQTTPAGGADLVEREAQWGIQRIFCTPHITQDTFENTPKVIADAFRLLQQEVSDRTLDVKLDYSAEHRLDAFFLAELEKGSIRPLPNYFLLVENPFVQEAWDLDNRLFDLNVKGYRPVLAHPERYTYYFPHPERYEQIHAAGTLFQVNLLSLAGYYGKEIKRVAEMLIEKKLVDFIGTDMHNASHADAIEKYIGSRDYKVHMRKLDGRILNDSAI